MHLYLYSGDPGLVSKFIVAQATPAQDCPQQFTLTNVPPNAVADSINAILDNNSTNSNTKILGFTMYSNASPFVNNIQTSGIMTALNTDTGLSLTYNAVALPALLPGDVVFCAMGTSSPLTYVKVQRTV